MNASTAATLADSPPRWTAFWAVAAICGFAYVANMLLIPVPLIPILGHDDGHFMFQAKSISEGQWLGPYDGMTLIKGPGFPLFLVLGRITGLPYPIPLAAFEFTSFALLSFVVSRLANSPRLGIVLLTTLAAFPWMWSGALLRVFRDGFYASLLFMFLALSFLVIWSELRRKWLVAIAAGLVFGWMAITREETPWLFPAVLAMAACFFMVEKRKSRALAGSVLIFLCAVLSSAVPSVLVATMNYTKYGVFLVTDFTERNFREALRALYSVEAGARIAYMPASRAARLASYDQSPTFARLRDALDGDPAKLAGWQSPGCSMHGGPFCGDYAGGWFMWAFRDAVADIGEYRTPQAAIEFYRSMAAEINGACREGRLSCRYSPVAELPPIISDNVTNTFEALGGIIARISLASPLPHEPQRSEGPSGMIHIAAVFLRVKMISPKALSGDDVVSRWQPRRLVAAAGWVQRTVREVFNFVWPALALAGGAAIVVSTIMSIGRRTVQPAMLITWLLLILIASRVALLALINGFLFRAINMEYTTPAAYCLVAATVIGFYCLIVELRARHSSRAAGR